MEWNGILWNGVECDAVEGTRRVWRGMGGYFREWNTMEPNGILARVSGTLPSGTECHGMVVGCNVKQQNAREHCGMEWHVVEWAGM